MNGFDDIIDRLDATDDKLRLVLTKALRTYTNQELFSFVQDSNPVLRTAAARELHIRGGKETFNVAAALAEHPRYEYRATAAFILSQLGTPHCPYASQSFDILKRLLHDDYYEVRSQAIYAVGWLSNLGREPRSDVLDIVLDCSIDVEPKVRSAVASALLSIRTDEARAVLRRLQSDPCADVREEAAYSLEDD